MKIIRIYPPKYVCFIQEWISGEYTHLSSNVICVEEEDSESNSCQFVHLSFRVLHAVSWYTLLGVICIRRCLLTSPSVCSVRWKRTHVVMHHMLVTKKQRSKAVSISYSMPSATCVTQTFRVCCTQASFLHRK